MERVWQLLMDSLRSLCARASVSLRTYTASQHGLAAIATNKVASTARSAVDVRIAFDIGRSSMQAGPGSRFLVVTKDHFGRALADVPSASTDQVTLDSPLPSHWRRLLGVPSLAQLVDEALRTKAAQAQLVGLPPPPTRRPATVEMHERGKQCHVCGVTVTRESEMHEHLVGKKHQRKLLQVQRDAARKLRQASTSLV